MTRLLTITLLLLCATGWGSSNIKHYKAMKKTLFILILAGLSALGYSQMLGGFVQAGGGGGGASVNLNSIVYTNDMEEYQYTKVVHNINGKLVGNTLIVPVDTNYIVVDQIQIITEPATTNDATIGARVSFGTNAPYYNNLVDTVRTDLTPLNVVIKNPIASKVLTDSVVMRVSNASNGDFCDVSIMVKYHVFDLKYRLGVRYRNAETEVLTDRFSAAPSQIQKYAIDSMITIFKDSLIWDNADVLYMMNVDDSTGAGQNWIENDNNLTATGSSSIDFTPGLGFINLTDAGHLVTGYVPSTDADKLTATSAMTAIKSSTNINAAKYDYGAITNSTYKIFAAIRSGDSYYAYIQNNAAVSASNSNSIGVFTQSRNVDTVWAYRGITQLVKSTSAHTDKPTLSLWIGDVNNGGSPLGNTRRRYSFFMAGGFMNAVQVRRLNNCLTWWDSRVALYF